MGRGRVVRGAAMKLELSSMTKFSAYHSLREREEPHEHHFELSVGITGPLRSGRVAGLVELNGILEEEVGPLKQTFLNENSKLDEASRQIPTCENLAAHFFERFVAKIRFHFGRDVELSWVEVKVLEPDGMPWGSAKWSV